jgi:glycosyltransferase involved in cell wall biosynthesis
VEQEFVSPRFDSAEMTALYLCYQSLLDPLTQTQVVAYLEGLARAGYRLVLLTFEPRRLSREECRAWRERLAAQGIAWYWCRYHKRPTVPATAFDILVGVVVGWWLVQRYNVRLLHARCHVPGLMSWALARLTAVKFLFDVRGLMAEEYVDAGVWGAGGRLFRVTKWVERLLMRDADGLVILTRRARELLRRWYPRELRGKLIEVIPCCVDWRRMQDVQPGNGDRHTLVYVGKLGGWYLTEAMIDFVAAAVRIDPTLRWQIWTQSDPGSLEPMLNARGIAGHVSISRTTPEALPAELARAHAGLSFIKPCISKAASSPTKMGEYLAAGLPVVSTAGIGDTEEVLRGPEGAGGGPVGVVVRSLDEPGYRQAIHELTGLLADPGVANRCRRAAREHFDLERVGWARYRQVYQQFRNK